MRTRADMLRLAIAFALIKARKIVRGLRQGGALSLPDGRLSSGFALLSTLPAPQKAAADACMLESVLTGLAATPVAIASNSIASAVAALN